ncbi:hypothetical protein ACQUW5_01320 [Legionella sp. CNM-1927-20]|uniref:hypothetical protein n=1 Tax=Legionella sp. CNM-1927-20 TaxID=3422221 RepID=UPI00403AFD36
MLPLTPETIEEIAKKACKYAQGFIIKGSTQLVNNTYDALQRNHIARGLEEVRDLFEDSKYSVEVDKIISKFYNIITLCKKFSLGSCTELSFIALDYVINNAPSNVNAEIFQLNNGDHLFLVIGRKEGSDPTKPESWGECAYICDPWSNKVYPASQYLTNLKGFFSLTEREADVVSYKNYIKDFDKSTHSVEPCKNYNAHYIRAAQSNAHIQEISSLFKAKAEGLLKAASDFEEELVKLSKELKEYDEYSDEYNVIFDLIVNIQTARREMEQRFKITNYGEDYLAFRAKLESTLKAGLQVYAKSLQVIEKNKTKLDHNPKPSSLIKGVQYFFKPPPDPIARLNRALEENKTKIDQILKP